MGWALHLVRKSEQAVEKVYDDVAVVPGISTLYAVGVGNHAGLASGRWMACCYSVLRGDPMTWIGCHGCQTLVQSS